MYFEDFTLGEKHYIPEIIIEEEDSIDFAEKYDPLSIHVDKEASEDSYFGDLIAPGLFTFCSIWRYIAKSKIYEKGLIAGMGLDFMRWLAPVYMGDRLRGETEIIELKRKNPKRGMMVLKLKIFNRKNQLVLETDIRALFRCCPEQ